MDWQQVSLTKPFEAAMEKPPGDEDDIPQFDMPRLYIPANGTLDEHILGDVMLDDVFIDRPLREHVNLSALRLSVPADTFSPTLPVGCWSFIEHRVKAIILKAMTDDLKSFEIACIKLRLFQKEVRDFLHTHSKECGRSSRVSNREAIAYGCEYLDLLGLGKYSKLVYELCRTDGGEPIFIDYSDLQLLYLPESRVSPIQAGFPTQEAISDLTPPQRIFNSRTDSVTIGFKLAQPASTGRFDTPVLRIQYFRLPARATVVGPEGRKVLREGGLYTVVYPEGYAEVPNAYEILICENDHTQKTPPEPAPECYSPVKSVTDEGLGATFFEDAFLDPAGEAERAMADSFIPQHVLDKFSALALPAEPLQSQKGLPPTPSGASHFPSGKVDSHDAAPLATSTATMKPPAWTGSFIRSPQRYPNLFGSDPGAAVPETAPSPQMPPQPRLEDIIGLIPNTQAPKVSKLVSKGYQALLQFRLPKGYFVISPSGHKMNLDILQGQMEGGDSRGGFGGEYTFIPFGHDFDPRLYRDQKLGNSDLIRMTFEEPMTVFRDGWMFPRIVGKGLHQLSLQDGELEISCKDGWYNLARPLTEPEPVHSTPQATEKPKEGARSTNAVRASQQATPTTPKQAPKKAAAKTGNRKCVGRRSTLSQVQSADDVYNYETDNSGSKGLQDAEDYNESPLGAASRKSTQNRKRTLDSVTINTTPQNERPAKIQNTSTPSDSIAVTQEAGPGQKQAQNEAQQQLEPLRVGVMKNAAALAEQIGQKRASPRLQARAGLGPQATAQPETQPTPQSKPQAKVEPKKQSNAQPQTPSSSQPATPVELQPEVDQNKQLEAQPQAQPQSETQQKPKLNAELNEESEAEAQAESPSQSSAKPVRIVLVNRKPPGTAPFPDQPGAGSGSNARKRSVSRAELEALSEPQPKKPRIRVMTPAKAEPSPQGQTRSQTRSQTRAQTKAQERTTRSNRRYSAYSFESN
ncbi:hypothetical protein F5Y13DRAFT_204339 [Hypoxylon sp. FL1857]|nr:hypothetical protein F5Y13DRAFT_204339 [Hypoxylon sp. FL1857]